MALLTFNLWYSRVLLSLHLTTNFSSIRPHQRLWLHQSFPTLSIISIRVNYPHLSYSVKIQFHNPSLLKFSILPEFQRSNGCALTMLLDPFQIGSISRRLTHYGMSIIFSQATIIHHYFDSSLWLSLLRAFLPVNMICTTGSL